MLLVVGASVIGCIQAGKVPAALPVLQREFGLGLFAAACLISAFTVVGASTGVLAARMAGRFGLMRSVVLGPSIGAVGCVVEVLLPGLPGLFVGRVMEGAGFLAASVCGPAILRSLVRPQDLRVALALWSSAVPTGVATAMLLGPLAAALGWRMVWMLVAIAGVALSAFLSRIRPGLSGSAAPRSNSNGSVLRHALSWRLAGVFGLYTLCWYAVLAFLPALLVSRFDVPLTQVGLFSAAVIGVNVAGNLVSSRLRRLGMHTWLVLVIAAVGMAACGAGTFGSVSPGSSLLCCAGFSFIAGLLPSAVFELASKHGRGPPTIGLIQQGVNIGQLVGPVVVGYLVQLEGWTAARWPVIVAAATIVLFAATLRPARLPVLVATE